jgi:hypothetical protein
MLRASGSYMEILTAWGLGVGRAVKVGVSGEIDRYWA